MVHLRDPALQMTLTGPRRALSSEGRALPYPPAGQPKLPPTDEARHGEAWQGQGVTPCLPWEREAEGNETIRER
jgi:DNA-binding protein H-NS